MKDNGDVIFHVYEKRKYSSIAQLAEHMTVNHRVAGSSPAGGAKNRHSSTEECRFYLLPLHFSLFPKKCSCTDF